YSSTWPQGGSRRRIVAARSRRAVLTYLPQVADAPQAAATSAPKSAVARQVVRERDSALSQSPASGPSSPQPNHDGTVRCANSRPGSALTGSAIGLRPLRPLRLCLRTADPATYPYRA